MAVEANRTVRISFVGEDKNVVSLLQGVDGKLRDVKGRFVSAGNEADLFAAQVRGVGRQAATGFGQVTAAAKQTQTALKSGVKSAQTFVKGIKDVGLIGLGFSQVASFVREAVVALDEFATETLEVEQVSRNLAFGIDAAAESTEGLVDNMTLARNANKAFALGVAQDSAEFAVLVGAATKIAQVQGISAQKLVEQAVVGIGRKSAARLDDLGILLDQAKAERIYAKSLKTTAGQLTALQKEEAFQKAALIEIQKAGDRAAASIDGFAITVAKGKIKLQNAKQGFQGFDDSLGKVREALRGISDAELDMFAKGAVGRAGMIERTENINTALGKWGLNIHDAVDAADELGVSFQDLVKGQKELREVQAVESTIKGLETLNQVAIRGLKEQSAEAEHQAKLGEARGENHKIVNLRRREALELARDAADLQFAQTQSTKDEIAALAAGRALELATVKKRGGGGGGPSRSDRVLAAGEQRVAQLETEARIAGILAEDAEAEAEAERASFEAARQRLSLELEALEATKARGAFARQELENQLAANRAAAAELSAEETAADQERVNELIGEAVSLETARSAAEADAASRRFGLRAEEEKQLGEGQARATEARARELELIGRTAEAEQLRAQAGAQIAQAQIAALENEFSAREILRQQAELELQANPPEKELERIEQTDALAAIAHEREMDRRQSDADAAKAQADLAQMLHDEELKRIKERKQKQADALSFTGNALKSGFALASQITAANIKDEDKRARHTLRVRGIESIATGALETVRAAAAFASFNIPEGILHSAAAGLAFAQGGIMLSGNIPGRGGGGGGGGEAATAAPRADRETGEAARIVESIPAADREPRQQPTTQQQGGGGTTIVFEEGSVQTLGDPGEGTFEKIRIGLDSVNNGLEAAG